MNNKNLKSSDVKKAFQGTRNSKMPLFLTECWQCKKLTNRNLVETGTFGGSYHLNFFTEETFRAELAPYNALIKRQENGIVMWYGNEEFFSEQIQGMLKNGWEYALKD